MKKRDILRDGIGKIEDSTLARFDKIEAEVEAKKAASEGKRRFPLIPIIAAAAVLAVIIAPITLKMTGSFGIFGPGERTEGSQSPESTPSEPTAETTPEAVTPETTPEAVTPETTPEASTPETTPETSTPETTPLYANITYEPSADGESYVIVSYEGNYENLTLPTMHDNKYVTAIAAEAFKGSTLEVVILPEFITEIGDGAFEGSANLRNVMLFQSVERIGDKAFKDCESLKKINLYKSLEYIGNRAFANCHKLEEVNIERGSELTSIEWDTFRSCHSLKSIIIPGNVQYIADGAFSGCYGLHTVTFAEGSVLESIGEQAFSNCIGLLDIELPAGVKSIGDLAFYYCRKLEYIYLPNTVSTIGEGIIIGTAMKRIFFSGTEEDWNAITKHERWNYYKTDCEVYFGDIRYEKVSITYVLGGGTGDSRNPEMLFKGGVISSLNDPALSGYNFIGWTWNGQSTPVRSPSNITVSEDMVFTAHWQASTHNELYEITQYTPIIDGKLDSEYEYSRKVTLRDNGSQYAHGDIYFLWDSEALYFHITIYDSTPQYQNMLFEEPESLDIFLSLYNYDPSAEYIEAKRADDIGDAQFRIMRTKDISDCTTVVDCGLKYKDGSHGGFGKWVYENTDLDNPQKGSNYIVHYNDDEKLVVEGFIKWSPELKEVIGGGLVIGIGLQYNDDINDDDKRDRKIYNDNAGDNSMSMSGNRATCGKFILVY